MATSDLAATYAALILADAESEITAEKILALTSAANVELEPIWATLLAKALEGKNVKEMLSTIGAGGGAPAGPVVGSNQNDESKDVVEDKPASDTEGGDDSDDDLFGGGLFD
ncbi:60S acidic ribosomal protein [Mycena chlorophos]|uniref:60S acidic ribosomal protein n=2 Tax=Mycena chlorophos TaxID=658473 RepID=A0ABQ0LW78_MYCCL|nr:60S acidic ribosomal protein [Mycena chlorophos]GAT54832.1 60S acidic ribosomal protein [Mycena chlorophos]